MEQEDRYRELMEIMGRIRHSATLHSPRLSLSHAEFHALLHIVGCKKQESMRPGLKMTELSQRMNMSKPAASKLVNALEDRGLVERVPDRQDRRIVYIRMTEEGSLELKKAKDLFDLVSNRILEEMGEEDVQTMIRLFNKLYQIISKIKLESEEQPDDQSSEIL